MYAAAASIQVYFTLDRLIINEQIFTALRAELSPQLFFRRRKIFAHKLGSVTPARATREIKSQTLAYTLLFESFEFDGKKYRLSSNKMS